MDYVEEAWRIVDPVLAMNTPVREYEPGTWGPADRAQDVAPPGGWANPTTKRPCRRMAEPAERLGDDSPGSHDARGAGRRRMAARHAAEIIAGEARAAVKARGCFSVAVSGGRTPWRCCAR